MPRQQRTSAPFRSAPFCCSVVRGSRFSSRYEARVLKRRQVWKEISLRHFQLSSTKRRFPKTTVIMSSTKFWMKSTVWQSGCLTTRAHKRTKCQMFLFISHSSTVLQTEGLADYFFQVLLLWNSNLVSLDSNILGAVREPGAKLWGYSRLSVLDLQSRVR